MINDAYIALGSNLSDPVLQVTQGIMHWHQSEGVEVLATSSLYRTPPWGEVNQPDFINAVIAIRTMHSPLELLDVAKQIEQKQQRIDTYRWGPRTLDCDIIHIKGWALESDKLTLPHPHWLHRAFVVVPLVELEPKLCINSLAVSEAYEKLSEADKRGITRLHQPTMTNPSTTHKVVES